MQSENIFDVGDITMHVVVLQRRLQTFFLTHVHSQLRIDVNIEEFSIDSPKIETKATQPISNYTSKTKTSPSRKQKHNNNNNNKKQRNKTKKHSVRYFVSHLWNKLDHSDREEPNVKCFFGCVSIQFSLDYTKHFQSAF